MKQIIVQAKAWREKGGVRPWLYLPLAFIAYALLDVALRYTFCDCASFSLFYPAATISTLGWCFVLIAIACVLPSKIKKGYLAISILFFAVLTVTHTVLRHMFRRFFMFSTLAFAGDGAAFADVSYIKVDGIIVFSIIVSLLLMLLAILLSPGKGEGTRKQTFGVGGVCLLLGIGSIFTVHLQWLMPSNTLAWNNYENPAAIYESFTDSTNALYVAGLYQYTFHDFALMLHVNQGIGANEQQAVEDYIAQRKLERQDHAFTGKFAGKNLMMIQLEAIDTWMLCEEYMPYLWNLKQESIVFANHYTPAYITAGTLNTEFMANTGLIPATGSVSTSVYERNAYPYSIANLMRSAGYSAESFHGSEGNVYNRSAIHPALGYEHYNSGSDMGMENFMLDHYLMSGYDKMVRQEPFYSFIVTYSGHGPYSESNLIYQAHADAAKAAAKCTEGNYVYAVAHAMETDEFIRDLMAQLEADGVLDDTVLVFYADHFNYYMMNDELNMKIKDVPNVDLLQHTDFFIYAKDVQPQTVSKVTSTLDILPTLSNLFALDDEKAVFFGNDAFSKAGGYAFFIDGTWVDETGYWSPQQPATEETAKRKEEISQALRMSNLLLKSDYFAP